MACQAEHADGASFEDPLRRYANTVAKDMRLSHRGTLTDGVLKAGSAATQAPEADKPTTGEGEKTVTEVAADKATEVAEAAKDAAVKTSDTVFSMFGGGPKKEEKPKADEEENDRSGSAKAQKEEKEDDVEADKVS